MGEDDMIEGSGSDAERQRKEQKKRKAKKASHSKEKSSKTKKRTKLAGEPKRGQSAFFLWMNENRDQIKKDNPGIALTEISKKAGEMWKEMEDKSKWIEKAAEDKARYEKELKKWKEGGNLKRTSESPEKEKGKPSEK